MITTLMKASTAFLNLISSFAISRMNRLPSFSPFLFSDSCVRACSCCYSCSFLPLFNLSLPCQYVLLFGPLAYAYLQRSTLKWCIFSCSSFLSQRLLLSTSVLVRGIISGSGRSIFFVWVPLQSSLVFKIRSWRIFRSVDSKLDTHRVGQTTLGRLLYSR